MALFLRMETQVRNSSCNGMCTSEAFEAMSEASVDVQAPGEKDECDIREWTERLFT